MPAGPELAGAAVDYYRRNRTFLAAFEPAREESFFTQEGQRSLLTEEARLAEEDRSYLSKHYMEDQLVGLLGGRVAESLCLGDISTGASNDLERASHIAREMVTKYGMSDELGLVSYDSDEEVFLGRDYGHTKGYGENVASKIDSEVKRIVDECYDKAKAIILDHRDVLDAAAALLLEKEKISRDEFEALFEKEEAVPAV